MDITDPSAYCRQRGNAQGGLARLAQARQDRPGKGGTGLNQYWNVERPQGFRIMWNLVVRVILPKRSLM